MPGTMPASPLLRQPGSDRCWFNSALGLSLMQSTMRQATPLLTSHIGVRGLYLRPSSAVSPLLSGNMLQSMVSLFRVADGYYGDLRCAEDALPIESDTLSLAYLLHAVDMSAEPASLLAECARVLRPEGVLFVVGLSTTSPWRLRWAGRNVHPLGERAMRNLLHEEGFAIEYSTGLGSVWPRLMDVQAKDDHEPPSQWIPDPLRASLLLMARKRRAGMTQVTLRKKQVALGSHAHAG